MLLLLLLLLLAAWLHSIPGQTTTLGTQILITANLLAMFRLWDDLSDISADRTTEPDRVLCRTTHVTSFRWTCGILGSTALSMLMLNSSKSGVGFIILTAFFTIYYKLPGRSSWPRLSYHLLIIKYPCFIFLICVPQDHAARPLHLMLMLLTYLTLCIYEVIHDPRLRTDSTCRVIAKVELVLAAITATWITNALL